MGPVYFQYFHTWGVLVKYSWLYPCLSQVKHLTVILYLLIFQINIPFFFFFFQYIKLYESSCQNIKKFPFCQLQNVVNNSQAQSTKRGMWWNCVVEFLTKSVAGKSYLQHNSVSDICIQLLLSLSLANGKPHIRISLHILKNNLSCKWTN